MPNIKEIRNFIKCIVSRYDETITEPPFETIPIDTVEVLEPSEDHLGELLCDRLKAACKAKGYKFKFYTSWHMGEEKYEIIVE